MAELLVALRNLCLMRTGPQDLPWSPTLLATLVGANVVLDVATGALLGLPELALGTSLVSLAVILGGIRVLLGMRGLEARFMQTGLATAMAMLAFSVLGAPVQLLMGRIPKDPSQITDAQMLAMLVLVGLACWALAVTAHILRSALERSFATGLLLALALNFGAAAVAALMIPVPAP